MVQFFQLILAPEGRKHVAWGASPRIKNRKQSKAPEGRKRRWRPKSLLPPLRG